MDTTSSAWLFDLRPSRSSFTKITGLGFPPSPRNTPPPQSQAYDVGDAGHRSILRAGEGPHIQEAPFLPFQLALEEEPGPQGTG
jgi:hypothetical protein